METIYTGGVGMRLFMDVEEHEAFIEAMEKLYEEDYRGFNGRERKVLNSFYNGLKNWKTLRDSSPREKL